MAEGRDGKQAANWVINELFGALAKQNKTLAESPIEPKGLGRLIDLIADQTINGRTAKDIFALMFDTGQAPETIVEERGLRQVTDAGAIEAEVERVIAANPGQVETYQKNPKVIGWFTGQVMKATGGKANPASVQAVLRAKLPPVEG